MVIRPAPAPHPGFHVKSKVIPKKVTQKQAAELLGVSRPTLSTLLNGNAALTPDMAKRLEKAFGASASELLAMQAAYDEYNSHETAKDLVVRTYVQRVLGIEARQIEAWADRSIPARAELPALLRRLVHSTGKDLTKVDFPAYDNAQRHGWDGQVVAGEATPWIPRGESGWEFGCDQDPAIKAEGDYKARCETDVITAEQRKAITFVFVTPRNWPGKDGWAEKKRKESIWKDVRAIDASDLEQWLEQSVATQGWFAERIGIPAAGVETLDESWRRWSADCQPALPESLFKAAVAASKARLLTWLTQPPGTALVVTADSIEEGLAFLAVALKDVGKTPNEYFDRALVLKTEESLKRTTTGVPDFIAITTTADVEKAAAGVQNTHHLITLRHHNTIGGGEPDIALDLIDDETFREALQEMGIDHADAPNYARQTGNSATILRRHLSRIPAVKNPSWASDAALARKLIPLNLVGVWDSGGTADQEILRVLADENYPKIEETITELRQLPEAPVWSIGRFRGVASKLDVLYATAGFVTAAHLDNFFFIAETVLAEDDPALDLPRNKQWQAAVWGKTRAHSSALRQGLCETLVLLAVHGNALFGTRLGRNLENEVDRLVGKLLLPLNGRTWSSQKGDLPRYAEAAPRVFLDILHKDLRQPKPQVYALLQPADSSLVGGGCDRTGLMWALETLAWSPKLLPDVTMILAELAKVPINDNWVNKPENSLFGIYRCWMPQTAATIDERNNLMEALCRKYPAVGWQLLMHQFGGHDTIGHYNYRPHWRKDASGAGQPVDDRRKAWAVSDKARELAITWPSHSDQTLGDLIERLSDMLPGDQDRVWLALDAWAKANTDEEAAHRLRERVRTCAFTRRARVRGVSEPVRDRARAAYKLLAPKDVVVKHLWLFLQHWVDESADELDDDKLDYNKRTERVEALRKSALTEIWAKGGYDRLLDLIARSGAENAIGWNLADGVVPVAERVAFASRLAAQPEPPAETKIATVLMGFLWKLGTEVRATLMTQLLAEMAAKGKKADALRLLRSAPFRGETWAHLSTLPPDWQAEYWKTAYVRWEDQDETETAQLADELIAAGRPRAAFHAIHMDFGKLDAQRLAKLLTAIATSSDEPAEHFRLSHHDLSNAFETLAGQANFDRAQLARLEFLYAEALDHSKYGIPTLEKELGKDPQLFFFLLRSAFVRRDKGPDPEEWKIANEEARRATARAAYSVISKLTRLPGTDEEGTVNADALIAWIKATRELAAPHDRAEITDQMIGQMLGRCPVGKDGVWPCEPVRRALDAIGSDDIAKGFHMGCYNKRGAHFTDGSGSAERELAAKYREWAEAVVFEYPFTAHALESLARSYDGEARMHETDAVVRRRLEH